MHIGVSNVSVEEVERARKVVEIAAVQNQYNIAERTNDSVVDYCTAEGIAFVPYFPLRAEISREVQTVADRHHASPQQVMLAWLLHRSPVMVPIPGTLSLDHLKQNLAAADLQLSKAELNALT